LEKENEMFSDARALAKMEREVFMSEVYHKPGSVCRIRYAKSTIFFGVP
jgi:hypothetical protein